MGQKRPHKCTISLGFLTTSQRLHTNLEFPDHTVFFVFAFRANAVVHWYNKHMKITRQMKRQARAAARANGVTPEKRVRTKQYVPNAQRMRKTIEYPFEEGDLVSIKRAMDAEKVTGIVIGKNPTHQSFFEVLANDGRVLNVSGFRLRRAD